MSGEGPVPLPCVPKPLWRRYPTSRLGTPNRRMKFRLSISDRPTLRQGKLPMTQRPPSASRHIQGTDPIRTPNKALAIWLFICCAMIFVMVVLGGVTRLTHSGLSMVEWKPVTGLLPPLGEEEWRDVFGKYQESPEYQKINTGMDLEKFKGIFWLEYIHRLWGRAIGAVFLLPFLFFLAKGWIGRTLGFHLAGMFLLGGLQGVLGWYMVKSGLVHRPDVSQYRLAAHLVAAFAIYGYIFWIALKLLLPAPDAAPSPTATTFKRLAGLVVALTFATVLSGAFVAGLDAGMAYNTFPLMEGRLVPEAMFDMSPWGLNFFENIATVQFNHRALAMTTLITVFALWLRGRSRAVSGRHARALHALGIMALVQVALGISTLLLLVPVPLAVIHQAGALVLFTLALWAAYELHGSRPQV